MKDKTIFLINNLKLYTLINYDEALKYYNLIKSDENLQDERFEIFFNYIEKMGYYENKTIKIFTNLVNIHLNYVIIMINYNYI